MASGTPRRFVRHQRPAGRPGSVTRFAPVPGVQPRAVGQGGVRSDYPLALGAQVEEVEELGGGHRLPAFPARRRWSFRICARFLLRSLLASWRCRLCPWRLGTGHLRVIGEEVIGQRATIAVNGMLRLLRLWRRTAWRICRAKFFLFNACFTL